MIRKIFVNHIMLFLVIFTALANVVLADRTSDLTVSLLDYSPKPIQPGQVMDIYIQVANYGNPTDDTSVEIIEEYPFILEMTEDIERAKHLGPIADKQTLQYRMRISEDAKDGIFPLKVRYKINSYERSYIEETFDINIETFDAKIDVLDIRQVPEELSPGEKGKLIISIKNDDDKPLKNIDIVLDLTNSYDVNTNMQNMLSVQAMINARLEEVNRRVASGLSPLRGVTPMMNEDMKDKGGKQTTDFDVIAPVGSSNQKRIPLIKARETQDIEFDIIALPDIAPNVYAIPLYINYNDEDNNPFHVRVDAPIMINMEPVTYVELKSTTLRTTDFSGEVVFTIANRGLSELRYVTLELQENNIIELLTAPKSIYIGNLLPGESKEGKFTIIAHERNITFEVLTSYRDSFNEEHYDLIGIPFYIINKNYYRDLPYEMWLAWLILGAVILILTIFFVIQMSRSKK